MNVRINIGGDSVIVERPNAESPIRLRIGDGGRGTRNTDLTPSQARQVGHLLLAAAEGP